MPSPVLEVRGLKKHFAVRRGLFGREGKWVKAVDGVDFAILPGETLQGAPVVDFVCRNEFDYTCVEVAENKPWPAR